MLLKLFFTLAVVLAVALIFRVKNPPQKSAPSTTGVSKQKSGVSSNVVIYTILGLIVSISILLFMVNWTKQHQVINIRVTNGQGETISYQAFKKMIEGRNFTTLDGVNVTLGASDRVEMLK
jgi:hypothetical protein